MPFVKLVKNKAYFKRFQVKYRRRREGKTDYRARHRLVVQDKNKYQSHRFRFVVRFTNTTVITQVIFAEIDGDRVLASAYSSELPRYGLKVGLKNYAAAYCTGLLLARRTLKKLGMDSEYEGNTNVDGNVFQPEELEERRPFKAMLDVGTRATTTGARLFGALKGASDGGFFIPHNEKRFPGYDKEAKEYNADVHRARIFGQHVADYMRQMADDDAEKYQKHFSQFLPDVDADGLEALYKKVHEAIRKNPEAKEKSDKPHDLKFKNATRRSLKQRQDRVKQKKLSRARKLLAAEEDA
jgi:large subunit ribosomal protein L5e